MIKPVATSYASITKQIGTMIKPLYIQHTLFLLPRTRKETFFIQLTAKQFQCLCLTYGLEKENDSGIYNKWQT